MVALHFLCDILSSHSVLHKIKILLELLSLSISVKHSIYTVLRIRIVLHEDQIRMSTCYSNNVSSPQLEVPEVTVKKKKKSAADDDEGKKRKKMTWKGKEKDAAEEEKPKTPDPPQTPEPPQGKSISKRGCSIRPKR